MQRLTWLAWRELWVSRGRSLLAVLALALSAGLVVATGSLGALMEASVARPASWLGRAADLWIGSAYDADYDLPAGLAAEVAAMPGVAGVQPVFRRPVQVSTPRADSLALLGVDPAAYLAAHDLRLAAGRLPTAGAPGLVALAPWALVQDLTLGSPVTITTPSGDTVLPITGLLEVDSLAGAHQGLVLYAPLDTLARLFGAYNVATSLEIYLEPSASGRRVRAELERRLGPAYAVSADTRPVGGAQLWQQLVLGSLVFVGTLTLVGAVSLVYAVFASAARARRRHTGLLRAVGATQRQVLALLSLEATLLGLVGGALGLGLGFLFARLAASLALPEAGPALPLPPAALLLALLLAVLGALAGALGPAIRASRQTPLAALYPLSHARLLPRHTSGGPSVRRERWGSRLPGELHLAAASLSRERGRAALIAGTLALILTMALGDVGVLSLLGGELAAGVSRLVGGDYVVLPGLTTISLRELAGQDTSDLPPLSPRLLAALEDLHDSVWLMRGTTANVEMLEVFAGQPTLLLDIEGYAHMGGFRFQAGNWPAALETFRAGPAALLTPIVARRLGVGLGDAVRLDTPHGPVDFTVAGIGDSEFTTCVLDLADGAAYLGANEVNGVEVKLRPGADGGQVRRELLDAVQTHGGTLLSLSQVAAQLQSVFDQAQLAMGLLIGITGLVAGLGVANAMLSSVAERRHEIGLLRAVGASRLQVGRLVLVEMALLGATASWLGTIFGWAVTLTFLAVARIYLGVMGEGLGSFAAWLPLTVASLAGLVLWPLLAILGGLASAIHAARQPVVQALYEQAPG